MTEPEPKSVEQMCRDLLNAAVLSGVDDCDPELLSGSDLAGVGNVLVGFLRAAVAAERERCAAVAEAYPVCGCDGWPCDQCGDAREIARRIREGKS